MSRWRDQSRKAAAEPWEETGWFSGRKVPGSAAWLENMLKGMDRCAQETIQQVQTALLQIKSLEEDGQAKKVSKDMQKAIAYLRERQHNLDRQRQRRFLLDTQGLWV